MRLYVKLFTSAAPNFTLKEHYILHQFNLFLNDLEIKQDFTPALSKYEDDSTIVAPVWKEGRDPLSGLVEEFMT